MPQMRQPQEATDLRQFLFQDVEKELGHRSDFQGSIQPAVRFRPLLSGGRGVGRIVFNFSLLFLLLCLSWTPCRHSPETVSPESVNNPQVFHTQVFDVNEKIIVKAITRVFKDRGFGEPRVEADENRLETDYVVQEDWRTKAMVTIKKISRRERAVTISVVTEKKSSGEWQPRKIMGKEQYDLLFDEIELQIYRELSKAE